MCFYVDYLVSALLFKQQFQNLQAQFYAGVTWKSCTTAFNGRPPPNVYKHTKEHIRSLPIMWVCVLGRGSCIKVLIVNKRIWNSVVLKSTYSLKAYENQGLWLRFFGLDWITLVVLYTFIFCCHFERFLWWRSSLHTTTPNKSMT